MPKPIALLVFVVVEIILLPITVLGQLLFYIDFAVRVPGKNLNLTTYDPAFARWILDALGKREDKAARQLIGYRAAGAVGWVKGRDADDLLEPGRSGPL